jgi:hypothetical protein
MGILRSFSDIYVRWIGVLRIHEVGVEKGSLYAEFFFYWEI